ncbi:dimethylamine monooxygenase subunit DmmA family protein [Nesterenkonia aurantiaca]|uniref:Dimethylamine monooxygenase subunit DmmA-like C-terminal domain-containing protein n=1 Tax=Nesterenkonia aurantiaca TaxID=1436010 RepID=A0A4R7G804_9MICC|nr:dimethylamine monooxygenase subunit DmmA family protein [Nesterenkonia aurantiaca]TDS87763.1 hypothetical protein EV640_101559 [Nesterenkonia aurantiaca]
MPQVLDHTSIPAWALEPTVQSVDARAAQCTILSYDAARVAGEWGSSLDAQGVRHRVLPFTPAGSFAAGSQRERDVALAEERRTLAVEVERAVVGWRLLIAGALADVLRVRALALQSGLMDAEIVIGTTSVKVIPVTCAHCEATTVTQAAAAQVITCGGCQLPLLVHHHVSRLKGAFLGYKNDAEVSVSDSEGPR